MKGRRYKEEQITGTLKAHEAGAKVSNLECEHGISEQSFYRWKSKCAGMDVSVVKRLRDLEQENARLTRLVAEAELDKAILKDVLGKVVKPSVRKDMAGYLQETFGISECRAC